MLVGKVSLSGRVDVVTLGLNQAFALFMAGVKNVRYHGIVGGDGEWMIDELKKLGFPSENILVRREIVPPPLHLFTLRA